jgi:hypothetical protein
VTLSRLQRVGRAYAIRHTGQLPLLHREAVDRRGIHQRAVLTAVATAEGAHREAHMAAFERARTELYALHRVAVGLSRRLATKRNATQLRLAAAAVIIIPAVAKWLRRQRQHRVKAASDFTSRQHKVEADETSRRTALEGDESAAWHSVRRGHDAVVARVRGIRTLQRFGRRALALRRGLAERRRTVELPEHVERFILEAECAKRRQAWQWMHPDPSGAAKLGRCWWSQAHALHVALQTRAAA